MIALRDGRLVLPDRVLDHGTLVLDASRIVEIAASPFASAHVTHDLRGAIVVPGFIDVHVHGIEGLDTLDEEAPLASIAARLPRYGVTAFCPTTVACNPAELARVLTAVMRERQQAPVGARVLPAHLESNFINPEYRGAQPLTCLRLPPSADRVPSSAQRASGPRSDGADYSGSDIVAALDARAGATAIVTMAPELPGGLDLVASLVGRGIRVSLGHSGATYEEACAGVAAGARHATHLFNRMSPLHHRDPGLVGAVLEHEDVDAELICDGYHVHPSAVRLALRAKSVEHIIAITDGTGGSGLPIGSTARLGGRRITVKDTAAFLDDGTLAGSTLTLDRAFRNVVQRFGCSLVEAARLCATNPARALRLADQGRLAPGQLADFVVLEEDLRVRETWVGGVRVWKAR